MYCLDDYDVDVFGAESGDEWAFIDIIFLPCNMKESVLWEDGNDKIDPQCVRDFTKQVNYIGGLNFLVLANEESFK